MTHTSTDPRYVEAFAGTHVTLAMVEAHADALQKYKDENGIPSPFLNLRTWREERAANPDDWFNHSLPMAVASLAPIAKLVYDAQAAEAAVRIQNIDLQNKALAFKGLAERAIKRLARGTPRR